jgi:hypothetical protein
MTKIADNKKIPDADALSLYAQTLKTYLHDNPDINEEWKDLINKLPAPRKIKQDLSHEECKILYETLEYLWEKITKNRIIPESEVISAPESLSGNYLMLKNGILLKGINSYDIIKRNSSLICSLLDISGMVLQEYLSGDPNQLIRLILKHGALRLFITSDKRFFSQCSPETYGKWAKKKIQKLDFKKRVVKLVDFKREYNGWKSGLVIILP